MNRMQSRRFARGGWTVPLICFWLARIVANQCALSIGRVPYWQCLLFFLLFLMLQDRARNQSERFSSTTTLTVNVKDDDDQDPSFIYQGCMLLDGSCVNPVYYATVSSGAVSGVLSVTPEKIQAVDMDSINAPILYSFVNGTPASFKDYFLIDPQTGTVKQTRAVDTSITKKFQLTIKAEEVSETKRFAVAKLIVTVKPVDSNPPQIKASDAEGFVDENAPKGTQVINSEDIPIKLTVSDPDLGPEDPKPFYIFELTTNSFTIDEDGFLVVNEENLDRDPPNPGKFRFQVVAREKSGNAASAPLSLTVNLNDVNDNAPRLPMISPVSVQAGEAHRQIVQVIATDVDEGKNAELTYNIYHVSNTGLNKFKIDPHTGVVETTGKLTAGEQYSITVQATDSGGKSSQTIVEVTVVPGPNTRSPVFQQFVYDVVVSEGAAINSTVTTINAVDPENDPVMYSIVSGNDLRQFAIGEKTGVVSVIRKLDREDLTRYQLLVKAEDEGGLSSTATINIRVSDINDKNPEFQDTPYEFSIKEGRSEVKVGQVKATDADEGQNAVVYYSLPDDIPFSIQEEDGVITTTEPLDYEKQQVYRFVVTARDGAPDPRLATATVTVSVLDVEDEEPIFHLTTYEAKVPENVPDFRVAQVKADDADTKKRVTYVIKQGPTEFFSIDPKTGIIRTTRGLDYERENQHILIVGTMENSGNTPGATTRVIVNVEDRNDIPPVFLNASPTINLDDNVEIGTKVGSLQATDSDATAPGNKVRYELVGRGKALKYFHIDPDLGILEVKDDLRKEKESQFQVDVKAYDLGEPQLSTITSVPVFIRHATTVPPETGLGFSDDFYTVQIPENSPPKTLIKTLTIINSRNQNAPIPLECTLASKNYSDLFYVQVTEDRNCELHLNEGKLDHELRNEYQLSIRLDSLSGYIAPSHSETKVKVQVTDINDNIPEFVYPSTSRRFHKKAYFGAISRDVKEVGLPVLQIKATDKDSGKFGQVTYSFVFDESGVGKYFSIDESSGLITNIGTFEKIDKGALPFRLIVEAKDNPGADSQDFNRARTQVVINLIEEKHKLILVVDDARPDSVKGAEENVINVLEDHSNLMIGVEKVGPRQNLGSDNMTIMSDPGGSDLWFYAINPDTETILERNSSRLMRSVLEPEVVSKITFDVSGNLTATASGIHPPLVVAQPKAAVVAAQWEVLPYGLIIIAALILVLGSAGIVYICVSWARYKAYKERMARMYHIPKYDPVFVEPNLKEYETQVLQMSVPVDDNDSYNDLQLDFSHKNHSFNLDNVGYITKENGGTSPVSSDGATTARASSIVRDFHHNGNNTLNKNHLGGHNNIGYDRSSDHPGSLNGHLNVSATNENVLFKEKKDYSQMGFNYLIDRSPVETTTEL
ncbi:unnamed protein product [Bemisia tabaci]|uniref:Cadherin domain-containing protein n=1 Tax=Bemisia tabaci TaxID=7038 RepID=A0A9P0AGV0_BEMTA|nr:unnamed protein product [Bemisia tabaci]